ncbi:MAG: RagB/SusD family nutrient uptake outer membrane protein, partial [Bacteroidetes bacterium]|nr:RagB/SusD family nutrient uptake outer membrane protein [Bacteroidota bacterium]
MRNISNYKWIQKGTFESFKPKLLFAFLLLSMIFINACDDFVEVDLPNSQLNTATVFQDRATANAAIIAIYAKMRDAGVLSGNVSGMSNQLGNYADELVYF